MTTRHHRAERQPRARRRYAIYMRTAAGVSKQPEGTTRTLAAQRDACVTFIQEQPGWFLMRERADVGYSGANTDRPELQSLLADVDRGDVDVVVVDTADRLTRWFLDFITMMERFEKAGVGFVSVAEGFSTLDPAGQRMLRFLFSFAELERTVVGALAAGLRRGAREAAAAGTSPQPGPALPAGPTLTLRLEPAVEEPDEAPGPADHVE